MSFTHFLLNAPNSQDSLCLSVCRLIYIWETQCFSKEHCCLIVRKSPVGILVGLVWLLGTSTDQVPKMRPGTIPSGKVKQTNTNWHWKNCKMALK